MSVCNSCNVPLGGDAEKAAHYASEFHAINAKRRAAELPPVTAAGYQRLKEQQAAEAKAAEEADVEVVYICEACHKTFNSEGQFSTHNSSKRHRETVKELLAARKAAKQAEKERAAAIAAGLAPPEPAPQPVAAGGSAAAEPGQAGAGGAGTEAGAEAGPGEIIIGSTNCVFCWQDQGDIESNLRHMQTAHSFFVPDVQYCTEPEGLIEYLHAKVVEARRCLWCTGSKAFETPEAARQHMADKSHCAMRYEEEADFEEYEQFYDYDDGEEEDAEGTDGALVLAGSEDMAALAAAGGDLPLANGGVARHRALLRYYKQRVRLPDERTSKLQAVVGRLALEYKAANAAGERDRHLPLSTRFNIGTGVRGNTGADAAAQRRVQKTEQHFKLHTGMWQNKILRRYFRIQAANTLS